MPTIAAENSNQFSDKNILSLLTFPSFFMIQWRSIHCNWLLNPLNIFLSVKYLYLFPLFLVSLNSLKTPGQLSHVIFYFLDSSDNFLIIQMRSNISGKDTKQVMFSIYHYIIPGHIISGQLNYLLLVPPYLTPLGRW